jgi:hypothetical protein
MMRVIKKCKIFGRNGALLNLPQDSGDGGHHCVWYDKCGPDPDYNDNVHILNCAYNGKPGNSAYVMGHLHDRLIFVSRDRRLHMRPTTKTGLIQFFVLLRMRQDTKTTVRVNKRIVRFW